MSKRDPFAAAQMRPEFAPGEPHLIGVSGGRDSMALLHWLVARGYRQLVVCHVDHGLRADSAGDAEFTRHCAQQWELQCIVRFTKVREFAEAENLSIEAAARAVRYREFARISKELRIPRLLLAHHADDQVETFLLQLLRGAGASGLGGMAPFTMRSIDGVELQIARPLLGVWRAEIDEYVAEHQVPFCEDATNAELEHTRNRIRHLALPALQEAFGRDPRAALWRAAEILRAEDELLEASPEVRELPKELSVRWLAALPIALQRRAIHKWLRSAEIPGVGFDETEAVRGLLTETRAKVNLPGGFCARRREKKLFIDRQSRME